MKADLTRNTFDPLKHFTRVILQQGRVQLDADWNEQASILLRCLEALAVDLIGPQGGPAKNLGFGITAYPNASPVTLDFQIAAIRGNVRQQGMGVYYVDGIRCEVDSTPVAISAPAGPTNTTSVKVEQWTLDRVPFFTGQYVELIDDVQLPNVTPAPPAVVQISDARQAGLKLTLQGITPASLSKYNVPKLRRVITYMQQPDYPVPDTQKLAANTSYLIYLDVWERHITYVEDDSIREVALGGPDTATRAKLVWQVKTAEGRGDSCDNFQPADQTLLNRLLGPDHGRLKAKAKEKGVSTDPCIVAPGARYRGPENQLYRLEIHRPGSPWDGAEGTRNSAATFKWSRENGSVVFPILSVNAGSGMITVALETLGRDDRFGLAEGDWVEIQDDPYVLQNRAENLLQVQSIDRMGMTVTLNGAPGSGVGQNVGNHPLLRRWDQQAGDPAEGRLVLGSDGAALIQEGVWLELESGVQIQFQRLVDTQNNPLNQYRTGDYWLIPARTATGDVEWPMEANTQGKPVPIAKPPNGITHHYAPLAVIATDTNGEVILKADCRKSFDWLAK